MLVIVGWELTCHLLRLDDGVVVVVVNGAVVGDGVDVGVVGDRMRWLVDWLGSGDVVVAVVGTWDLFGLGLEWAHWRGAMALLEKRLAAVVDSSCAVPAVVVVELSLVVEAAGQVELVQFVLVGVDT